MGRDCSWGIFTFGWAEAQARAAQGFGRVLALLSMLSCPGLALLPAPHGAVPGAWWCIWILVSYSYIWASVHHLSGQQSDPSYLLTLRLQNHRLNWEPIFSLEGAGMGVQEMAQQAITVLLLRKTNCVKNTRPYRGCAVAILTGNRPKHHTTLLSAANLSNPILYYSSSGLRCFQLVFCLWERKLTGCHRIVQKPS